MDPLWIVFPLWFDLNQYNFYKTRQIRGQCFQFFWSILQGKYTRKPWLEMTILINDWSKGGKNASAVRWMVFFRSQCASNVNQRGLSINDNTLSSHMSNTEGKSFQHIYIKAAELVWLLNFFVRNCFQYFHENENGDWRNHRISRSWRCSNVLWTMASLLSIRWPPEVLIHRSLTVHIVFMSSPPGTANTKLSTRC